MYIGMLEALAQRIRYQLLVIIDYVLAAMHLCEL
jgi:hypothetical protein